MARDELIERVARELWAAEQTQTPVQPLHGRPDAPAPDDAYAIQSAVTALRVSTGQRIVGRKVGLTSRSMQEMSGVTEPDYGSLFDVMRLDHPGVIERSTLIQPMVEPELGFVMADNLAGHTVTRSDVLRACAYVTPVLEIVDSRIEGWQIKWVDTVADNASAGKFVVGSRGVSAVHTDLRTVGVVFECNDTVVSTAAMAEVLDDPVNAVVWLANRLHAHGVTIAAGDIILAGAPCRAIPLEAGDRITAHMSGLGAVTVRAV